MGAVGPAGNDWVGAAGAMLALILLAFQTPLQAQPAPREADIRLGWRPGWTETGITVAPGETVTIRVRTVRGSANDGQQETAIDPATGRTANVEPREGKSLADTLLKAAARQVIVGRVGEGPRFVVGRRYRQTMKAGGALSLRWDVPREMAAAGRGFDVAIRVDPAPVADKKPDESGPTHTIVDEPVRNSTGPTDPVRNPTGPSDPVRNTTAQTDPVRNEGIPAENESVVDPAPGEANESLAEQNFVQPADPEVSTVPTNEATETEGLETVTADGPETGLSAAQMALIGGGMAAFLLVLAAAGVGVQRWRRRKLVQRTRSLLSLSPKLDLGEGACRGGSLPAEGPAASLRARLEEGAIRSVGGGEDG